MASLFSDSGSSPRWRGRLLDALPDPPDVGLIPALAGTTRHPQPHPAPPPAHPRAGGDDQRPRRATGPRRGSSPRWRGRLVKVMWRSMMMLRLIPALAGTTDTAPARSNLRRAHPRAGGDDNNIVPAPGSSLGSSPRWRGRPQEAAALAGRAGLIPALAGTTGGRSSRKPNVWAHPRAGGDDVGDVTGAHQLAGSSPRWRGRRPSPRRFAARVTGSSPRWRGRLFVRAKNPCRSGLIPALAGTTGMERRYS